MTWDNTGSPAANVAVVVVNYNTRDLLAGCLQSIAAERPSEVVVVDNGSPDGSASFVRERFADVDLIANTSNAGYGPAVNQALRGTSKPLVLVLNADTEVQAGCIAGLALAAERAPRAGIIAPAILNWSGVAQPSYFPFPGTLDWLLENEPLAPLVRRVPPLMRRAVSFQPPVAARRVPWVLGCALLLRRSAAESVGGFDESFFMYYEEVDLCRRLTDEGWEVHFTPDARVKHVGGASTSQVRTAMLIRHLKSTLQYYRRHHSGPRLAFWVAALHAKRAALLARDSAQLLTEKDPAERERLREQRRAWAASLGISRNGTSVTNGAGRAGERGFS